MKINKIIYATLFGCGILLAACSELSKEPQGNNKPQTEEKTNDLFWSLPATGAAKVYPGSTTSYKPIMVNYSNQYSPVPDNGWRRAETRIIPNIVGYEPQIKTLSQYREITNKYGSYTKGKHYPATGRFYITKEDGRYWFVDPEGYPLYMRGTTSFAQSEPKFSDDMSYFVSHFQEKLSELGVHGIGAFSPTYLDMKKHNELHPEAPLPFAPSMAFLGAFKNAKGLTLPNNDSNYKIGVVFCDGWEDFCISYMKSSTFEPYIKNKDVFGFFSDNEINFSSMNTMILAELLKDESHPAGIAAKKFMEEKGATKVTKELNLEFAGIMAEKYYGAIRKAVDIVDPDLLYLGSRLHGTPKYMKTVIEAAGRYCDVISINYYSRWSPEPQKMAEWAQWAPETPFMVTEFYTKSDDRNECKNDSGAGFMVKTQEERAYAYEHFTLGLLEAKNCVGWTWFNFMDRDCNKGLYTTSYHPWIHLQTAVRQVNQNVYNLIDFFQGK